MADVDFSHAVLDVRSDITPINPMSQSTYLLFFVTGTLYDSNSGWVVSSGATRTVLSDTPTKVSILFTGTFSTSGTEFYMGDNSAAAERRPWKVSNISYSAGDTYSFIIDIETSGNV